MRASFYPKPASKNNHDILPLTLPHLAHKMEPQLNGLQGRDSNAVATLVACTCNASAEGANLDERRNQMKLSGKRTLYPHKLWKVSFPWDTDGVKLVSLIVEQFFSSVVNWLLIYETTKPPNYQTNLSGSITEDAGL